MVCDRNGRIWTKFVFLFSSSMTARANLEPRTARTTTNWLHVVVIGIRSYVSTERYLSELLLGKSFRGPDCELFASAAYEVPAIVWLCIYYAPCVADTPHVASCAVEHASCCWVSSWSQVMLSG